MAYRAATGTEYDIYVMTADGSSQTPSPTVGPLEFSLRAGCSGVLKPAAQIPVARQFGRLACEWSGRVPEPAVTD